MRLSRYTANYITIFLFVAASVALLTGCGSASTTEKDCPQGQVYSYTTKQCENANDYP